MKKTRGPPDRIYKLYTMGLIVDPQIRLLTVQMNNTTNTEYVRTAIQCVIISSVLKIGMDQWATG